ncbi:MAG TPA: hypothetical protein VI728_00395 [Syntrophales bacterium]|nr:hypothetical protein [Syntrophales bacterium]
MTTIATAFSRHIRRQGAAYRTFSWPGYMKRFPYFIEHSDWDELSLIHEEWVNELCVGLIIASVLYFAIVLGIVLME